ncbi:MAG TPA: nitric-oxide reductase large subunit, partial [Casimicrobiaceae bacterium]|nr:nitric-oxide reductase large subunit [Casimicrobiaceae bacterium]
MQPTTKLWRWLGIVFVLSFAALGWIGREIYVAKPPIATVQGPGARTLFSADDVEVGQGVWRSAGGQQLGSVWGHGSYVAPDWSADWLHREAEALRDEIALRDHRKPFAQLTPAEKAATLDAMKAEMRRNTYDPATNVVTVSAERARAIERVAAHYAGVFGNDPAFAKLREQYAMMDNTLPAAENRHRLAAFFFWSSWSASTDRP